MRVNKVWAVFTLVLVLICIGLASHLSYRKVAKHFRDKRELVGVGSGYGFKAPMTPLSAPGGTVLFAPSSPSSTIPPEVAIAKYEMIGMLGSGFLSLLGIVLPFVLPKWLKTKK